MVLGADFDPQISSEEDASRLRKAFAKRLLENQVVKLDEMIADLDFSDWLLNGCRTTFARTALSDVESISRCAIGRADASAIALISCAQYTISKLANPIASIQKQVVAISGCGELATAIARHALHQEWIVTTFSDRGGTLIKRDGFRMDEILKIQSAVATCRSLAYIARTMDADCSLECLADLKPWHQDLGTTIAIPCMMENELDEDDVKSLVRSGVRCIVEGSASAMIGM